MVNALRRILSFLPCMAILILLLTQSGLAREAVPASMQTIPEEPTSMFDDFRGDDETFEKIEEFEDEVSTELTDLSCNILQYVDEAAFAKGEHLFRLPNEEKLNTYVFLNRDGTKSVYAFDENIKFVDHDKMIKEKDITLFESHDGFAVKENEFKLLIPHSMKDGVSLQYEEHSIKMKPLGGEHSVAAKLKENAVWFENFYGTGSHLRYSPLLSGVKEEIILDSASEESFHIAIETNGLFVCEIEGKYYLSDKEQIKDVSSALMRIGDLIIYDANGRPGDGSVRVETVRPGEEYVLVYEPNVDFLLDPETKYPVVIDPTITISDNTEEGLIEDTVLFSGKPTRNYGTYLYLTAGYTDDTYKIGRVAVRLPGLYNDSVYADLSSSDITSVKFYCRDSSGHAARTVHLYRMTAAWTETTATWNTVGSSYSTAVDWGTSMASSGFTEFDITSLVKGWKSGSYNASYGLVLVNSDETTQANKKAPFSSEYTANTSYRPYVVMTYSPITGSIALNSTQVDVVKGGTTTLTAITSPGGLSVSWSSSKPAVATVSSSGVVTAVNPGSAVITASCTYNGVVSTAQCTVYVTISDGFYMFRNKNSGYYLTNTHGLDGTRNVYQTTMQPVAQTTEWISQLWRVNYIGNGKYSIRPMNYLSRGLDVTGTNADTYFIGVSDTSVPSYAQWTIEYTTYSNTYVFKNGGSASKTLQVANTSAENGANVCVGAYSATNNCRWVLEKYNNPPTGIYLIDKEKNTVLADTNTGLTASVQYIAPEETRNLVAVQYSRYTLSQSFTYQSGNQSKVNVTSSGAVKGISPSDNTVSVTANIAVNGVNRSISYLMRVTQLPNGTYFIKNKETLYYAESEGSTNTIESSVQQWQYHGGDSQRWIFTHLGDGYYSIRSANSASGNYLGVLNDSIENAEYVVLRGGSLTPGMKWKISTTSSGGYKITPQNGEFANMGLALERFLLNNNAIRLVQREYIADNNFEDEWLLTRLQQYTAYVNDFYDMGYLIRYDESENEAKNEIQTFIDAVSIEYLRLFGLTIRTSESAYYESPVDICKGTVSSSNIDTLCPHGGDSHTDRRTIVDNFFIVHPGDLTTTNIYWSGHRITSTATNGQTNFNRSCSYYSTIYLISIHHFLREHYYTSVLMHELNHQYGAPDHYHELADLNDDTSCKFKAICSVCGTNPRPSSCIMNDSSRSISNDDIICEACKADIYFHLEEHHKNN